MKEEPEETANGRSILLYVKSPWEGDNQKESSGLEENSEVAASGEEDASKEKDRSLLCSTYKKRIRKTWIDKLAEIEPKYMYMWMFLLLFMVPSVSGTHGKVNLLQGDFRKTIIGTDETQIVTEKIYKPVNLSVFSVFAKGGNDRESYKCTSDFVSKNQSCSIVVGNKSRAECEGLRISRNGSYTYLAVDGSKLAHDHTTFCIYQQVPSNYALYFLEVSKNQAPETTHCLAFKIVVPILSILLIIFAMLYIRERSRG